MNISEDLKAIESAVIHFRRHDEVDAYRIVEPAETALRNSCERMKTIEEAKAKTCYDSDLVPEIKKFSGALQQYAKNQDYGTLRSVMEQIQRSLKDFNKSVDYLIRTGLVREESRQPVIIIPQNQQNTTMKPLRRKTSAEPPAGQQKSAPPPKRRTVPARKTLTEKYFLSSGTAADEKALNKNIEVIVKVTAEEPESGAVILEYYLANKNAFRRKESYQNFWCRLIRKNKRISYQQAFRVSDWKPLFLEDNLPEEYLLLSKNIFGVPREGNLQDDGLLLKLREDSLQISFKTYGERASKSLKSEFSGQTQPAVVLSRKDFSDKNDRYSCHYQDIISFWHQFNHVKSDWNQKEVLVKLKIDMKLK